MSLVVAPIRVTNGAFINYTYLLAGQGGGTALLIDPAWERLRIEAELGRRGVRLGAILLTHAHEDHTDLAEGLALDYGAGVWISRLEADFYGFKAPNLRLLDGRDEVEIAGFKITVIETPGHTAGGVCYLVDGNLFTGDTLFLEGCGICTCEGADPGAMFRSLQILKQRVPSSCRIFPGHSYGAEPGLTFGELTRRNIYLAFENEESFVRFRMRPNQFSRKK